MESDAALFRLIDRSHPTWYRKPLTGLMELFAEVRPGDLVVDPFCGSGTPVVAALIHGARVIACDTSPLAILLTRALIRPCNLYTLAAACDRIRAQLRPQSEAAYATACPECSSPATIAHVKWQVAGDAAATPKSVWIDCACGFSEAVDCPVDEQQRQAILASHPPATPHPTRFRDGSVHQRRLDELFTGRNLNLLASLRRAIQAVDDHQLRDALSYAFSAALYPCSRCQITAPGAHPGTALDPHFTIGPLQYEINPLRAFDDAYQRFVWCKRSLNEVIPFVRVTDSPQRFSENGYEALVMHCGHAEVPDDLLSRAGTVFLDPPGVTEAPYLSAADFWACWFGAEYETPPAVHDLPETTQLLKRIHFTAGPECSVSIAFSPQATDIWDLQEAIRAAGYQVEHIGTFRDDTRQAAEAGEEIDHSYLTLRAQEADTAHFDEAAFLARLVSRNVSPAEVTPYLRTAAFLWPHKNPERTRLLAAKLMPGDYLHALDEISISDLEAATACSEDNARAYHSLCFVLAAAILREDGWRITAANRNMLEPRAFSIRIPANTAGNLGAAAERAALLAERHAVFLAEDGARKIMFFFDDLDPALLEDAAAAALRQDGNDFNAVCVMICRSPEAMQRRREIDRARWWPRGFYTTFEDLRTRCAEVAPKKYDSVCSPQPRSVAPDTRTPRAAVFDAEVVENIPVGDDHASHYKLRFRAPELRDVAPGQFIMMDTAPDTPPPKHQPVDWAEFEQSYPAQAKAYLKRPFGIHRAYYPNFDPAYLKNLALPRAIAAILHTSQPEQFDMLYKVLPNGVGTSQLTGLRRGDRVQMVGPLGKRFDLVAFLDQGFDEIHVIGGGVGVAPLIYLVQALRFLDVPLKAFIGVPDIGTLKHADRLAATYVEDPADVHIYVDDLVAMGLDRRDIYVSSDRQCDMGNIVPRGNFRRGTVADLYIDFLEAGDNRGRVGAFTCGPMPMMKAIANIAACNRIPLKVLMEKRMACGIGVCLSCVCKVHANGGSHARVCAEGPIFDAGEIVWD